MFLPMTFCLPLIHPLLPEGLLISWEAVLLLGSRICPIFCSLSLHPFFVGGKRFLTPLPACLTDQPQFALPNSSAKIFILPRSSIIKHFLYSEQNGRRRNCAMSTRLLPLDCSPAGGEGLTETVQIHLYH